jgi:uncharacterized protein
MRNRSEIERAVGPDPHPTGAGGAGGHGPVQDSDRNGALPSRGSVGSPHRLPIWRFFLISHGFTWSFWIAAALLAGPDVWSTPARWLVYLGGVGPMIAGLWMTFQVSGGKGLRELGRRVTDPRRVPARWLAVALLLPVFAMAGAVGAAALGGALPQSVDASRLLHLAGDPLALLTFALFVLVFGPVPEEIGWRGYALDALQTRWSALTASLLLGLAWALWHAPLFFIAGYYRAESPPDPVLFAVAILAHSVVYTWIYNHTGRSVFVAILFHFMVNLTGMLVEGAVWVEWTRTGLTAVVALAAVAVWGAGSLTRRSRVVRAI